MCTARVTNLGVRKLGSPGTPHVNMVYIKGDVQASLFDMSEVHCEIAVGFSIHSRLHPALVLSTHDLKPAFQRNKISQAPIDVVRHKFEKYEHIPHCALLRIESELKDVVINLIEPISSGIQDIKNDKTLLINTLKLGSDKAREIATKTISDVDNLMGLNIE